MPHVGDVGEGRGRMNGPTETVGSGAKGRDNVATYGTKRPYDLLGFDTPLLDIN